MDTVSTYSRGKGRASDSSKDSTAGEGGAVGSGCCDIDIRIDAQGDVNIYNCSTPGGTSTTPTPPRQPCYPPYGACLPVVPGAKHKLSREYKLAKLAAEARVPSSLAAGAAHMMRRYLLGKSAANPLEAKAFAVLGRMSRDIVECSVAAVDAMPPRQRNRLLAPSLILDPDQPISEGILSAALAEEIKQRVGVLVFNDPQGVDEERPGAIRVYEPHGEDFFNQVRICTVNGLRTANYIPALNIGDYLPAEIQRDCNPVVVNGQPPDCQDRTTNCPGHSLGPVCARVLDIAQGDGVTLVGVNYFSVDAVVRFSDPQTGNPVRDVDAHVFGDVDTQVTEVINGQTVLINDCRVHDQLTFSVPADLAPQVYQIQVVVPNITGIAALGAELVSNVEFINVIPPATARFRIVTEWINARQETSPAWFGSDEVGLHTLAAAVDLDFNVLDLDPDPNKTLMEQKFKDLQSVDFDSGTNRHLTTTVFAHDQPFLGMLLVVLGDEIDSQRFYDGEVTSQTEFFFELLLIEAGAIGGALGALKGAGLLAKLAAIAWWVYAIAAAVLIGIDILIAWWAPADPIIRDSFGLSVNDLAALTSINSPAPDPRTFSASDGIVVNVNKTIPPKKLPFEYHETREYVSDDQDSRYEITYRFNRVA
jgi:hypothetical protein